MAMRLVICEEHAVMRAGIRAIFTREPDVVIAAEASSVRQAAALLTGARPDAVLTGTLDDALEFTRGPAAGGCARDAPARPGVITFIGPEDESRVLHGLRAGVRGMVNRGASPRDLVQAVRTVGAGQASLTPAVTLRLLDWAAGGAPPAAPSAAAGSLSQSELRVLRLLAQGLDGGQIAGTLGVTQATIRSHVHHMLTKLGLRSRSQAVAFAYQHGLLMPWASDHEHPATAAAPR